MTGTTTASGTGGFIWYELLTTDPDGAAAFYGPVTGWRVVSGGPAAPGGAEYRHIVRGDGGSAGGVFRLTDEMCAAGTRPCWLGYIHVADVDRAVAAIVADGGKVLMPKATIQPGSFALVADPQGVPFYVMTPAPPPGQPDAKSDVFDPEKPQHVRWNELSAPDPVPAVDFYRRHFGWDQQGEMDMGALGAYRFLQHGGVAIGAVMPMMPGQPMPLWTFYIGVDDIDRAHAAVVANGGMVIAGPDEIPGGEYSLCAVDPQGAAFGLVGPRKG